MRHAGKVMLFALSLCLFERIVLGGTAALSQEFDSKPANGQKRFTIASCNLRKADLSDPNAIKTTAEMISSFDVVALQCLQSDKAETDMLCLVEELNRNCHQFGYLLSSNAGDLPYGYAFIYRFGKMYPIAWHSFDDSQKNAFECEPFIADFETDDGMFNIALINYYIEPESRSQEIASLPAVVDDVKAKFLDESDIIILCSATGFNYADTSTNPFKPLEQDGFILLLNSEETQGCDLRKTVEPQIVIAESSDEMYFEDAGTLVVDSLSNAETNPETALSTEYAGYGSVIFVSSKPDNPEYDDKDTKTKAGCFFSTSN